MSDKNDGSIIISAKIDDAAYKKSLSNLEKLTKLFCDGTVKRFSRLKDVGKDIVKAFGGPWGVALKVASAAVDYFSSRQSESEKVAQRYGTTVDALRDKYARLAEEAKSAAGATNNLTAAQRATAASLRDAQLKEMERIKRGLAGRRELDVLFLYLFLL